QAGSFIYDYLKANGYDDFAIQYDLLPFELNVQAAERTMIDKLYALADYYLAGEISEHSRHIYDIYKLSSIVSVDEKLRHLVVQVAEERRPHSRSLSVQEGVNIKQVLLEIIEKQVYRNDYEKVTSALLFESISYDTAVMALNEIVNSGLYDGLA
ncbi:MAG: nucleotidyl transferase AbiEii/AbiGii toxin family protein, partial [Ruminococcaceae bacterium]|nr:nucleotidyl transferase AbiEii/AbiGii toxin family protein [Oscillospiraceae bacterium]